MYYYYLDKRIQVCIHRLLLHSDDELDKYHTQVLLLLDYNNEIKETIHNRYFPRIIYLFILSCCAVNHHSVIAKLVMCRIFINPDDEFYQGMRDLRSQSSYRNSLSMKKE